MNNTDPKYMDNTRTWNILMGHVLFSGSLPEGRLADNVEDHIRSLDEYIDSIVLMKFKEIGIGATDLYQVFGIVIEKISDWLFKASDKVNSLYDKELSILYFVLKDITAEIFKLYFKLKAASKKELTKKDIEDWMNKTISTGLIYRITKQHAEVSIETLETVAVATINETNLITFCEWLCTWFVRLLTKGKMLSFYGIDQRRIGAALSAATEEQIIDRQTRQEQQQIREQIEVLYDQLSKESKEWISEHLKHQLRMLELDRRLALEHGEIFSLDTLINNAREKKREWMRDRVSNRRNMPVQYNNLHGHFSDRPPTMSMNAYERRFLRAA